MALEASLMNRRWMLKRVVVTGLASSIAWRTSHAGESRGALPDPSARKLPRWRGFNLLEMFQAAGSRPFREEDFAWIAELGFDFVRLPLDYRCWTYRGDWTKLKDDVLRWLDHAVELGEKNGIHVQLNFHRAPGYTVAAAGVQITVDRYRGSGCLCAALGTLGPAIPEGPQSTAQFQPVQ
jgi:endoglucanase